MSSAVIFGFLKGLASVCVLTVLLSVSALCSSAAEQAASETPAATPAAPAANSDASCLECHSDTTLFTKRDGTKISLFVNPKLLAGSPHSGQSCIDCHDGFDGEKMPHKTPLTKVDCASCHEKPGKSHAFHPHLAQSPIPAGRDTHCSACHGTHAIVGKKSPKFPGNPEQQTEACGQCHKTAAATFASSAHARNPGAQGIGNAPTCLSCHKTQISATGQKNKSAELKLAQVKLCESCHVDKDEVSAKTVLGSRFVMSFDKSVHGAALTKGNAAAAGCVDCHGSHETNQAMKSGSKVSHQHVAATCAKCHEKEAKEFGSSSHAVALAKGNHDSPSCTGCHGEHDIRSHKDPTSPVFAKNVSQQVCASCHASVRLSNKYGLSSDRFETFTDSYHGLATRGGAVSVVNCASCHGAHAIKSDKDPTSSVHKTRLAETCGRCHPGANTRFGEGSVHANAKQADTDPLLYWVTNIYVILIIVVVGGMAVHNFLDFFKKARRKLAIQKGTIVEEHVEHRLYLRMNVEERLQHASLVISFVLLVITGFALRYPEAWWVSGIQQISDRAFELRGIIHRIAGIVMIVAGAWHLGYLAATPRGRELFRDLLPRWNDLTDPWKVLRYNLGLSKDKPKFGRFCYIEKAEYWALIWGTLIMCITGAVLWFDNTSMGLISKLGFDVSRAIHFYEAILATLAIIVWHFYFVIFNPDVYPMNLSWLTGRMSEREMMEEHPAELERLKKLEANTPEAPHDSKSEPKK